VLSVASTLCVKCEDVIKYRYNGTYSETGYDAFDDATDKKIPDVTSSALIVQYDTLKMENYTVTTDYMYDDVTFTLEGLDRTTKLPGLGFA